MISESEEKDMRWIDMHCDTLSELQKAESCACSGTNGNGYQGMRKNSLCVDIERLIRKGASAQFFACYVNAAEYPENRAAYPKNGSAYQGKRNVYNWNRAYEAVLEMLEYAHQEASLALSIPGCLIYESANEGKTAGILTVEEGGVLDGDLSRLDDLYQRDVRLITLTWNYKNCIGYPNSRNHDIMAKGLTHFGKEAVEKMNDLGMIIDVSHLSDGGFWDCIRCSRTPIVASHSNARSLCAHPRNLSDEMLRALGNNGGLAGINFYSAFLREEGVADPDDIAAHAAWMIRKSGEDSVALGSDFDGFDPDSLPAGIQGVQDMDRVWEAMRREGITPRQIDKIAYENAARVINEVCHLAFPFI